MAVTAPVKPLLRGHIHQATFFIALGSSAMLIAKSSSSGTKAVVSTIIYSFTLLLLFGISALYHRPQWNEKNRKIMKRLDHAAIFMIIAGSCLPICVLGLGGALGTKLIMLILIACSLGMLKEILWIRSPKWVSATLYVAVGWTIIPFSAQLLAGLGTVNFSLLLGGGILYTLGATFYAMKRPNFYPNIFGYHELFHTFVVIAAACHFILIYRIVTTC